jgi:hypothetical protein
MPGSVNLQKICHQIGYVFRPRTERWKFDADHVNAIVQVLTKPAIRDFHFEPAIGRTDHSQSNVPVFLPANSIVLPILQQLKQFGLQGHVDLIDAIEKQSPNIG